MKNPFGRLIAAGMLMCAIGFGTAAHAADEPAKAPAATVLAQATTEPAAAATATAAPAAAAPTAAAAAEPAAATPVPNKGDVAWMTVATILVAMMSIPGLALFYGGLVRSKNMLSVLMQVFMVFSLIMVLWAIYGYSLAFTQGGSFIGSFDRLFLKGITVDTLTGTFSKGVVLPELTFVTFQATFAAITCGLIVGAFAERVRFSAVLLFVVLWFTFSYLPIAHMVCSGLVRTPTPAPPQPRPRPLLPAGCSRKARSTLPAAPWCISMPPLPAWLAPSSSASASAMAVKPWRRIR